MMYNIDSLSQDAPPNQKTIDQQEEQWAKRSERPAKHRSKYFDPPEAVPQPKKRRAKQTPEDHSKDISPGILQFSIMSLFTLTQTTFNIISKYPFADTSSVVQESM